LRSGICRAEHLAGDARGRGDCEQQAGALLAHHRQDGASDIHRAEQQRLELIADLFRAELLEEAGEEVARVIDQDVESAELRDGGLDCCLRIQWAGDVEFVCQEVVMVAPRGRDLRRIAPRGDNGVASCQDGLGDVDSQASPSAGDEPHLLSSHDIFLTWTATTRPNVVLLPPPPPYPSPAAIVLGRRPPINSFLQISLRVVEWRPTDWCGDLSAEVPL